MDKNIVDFIQNREIEQKVLGSIIIDETLFASIETYNTDLFYYDMHKKIFEAMKIIKKNNQPLDIITLSDMVRDKYKNFPVTYIAELAGSIVSTVNFETYVNMLVDYKNKFNIFKTLNSIDFADSSENIGNKIYKLLDHILIIKNEDFSTKEALMNYIDSLYKPKDDNVVKLGLNAIDKKTGGLLSGELITITGYTGMGKSILVSQIILNMLKKGRKIDLFSLEMNRDEIFNKIISNACNIDFNKIRNKDTSDDEKEQITKFIAEFLISKDFEVYEYIDDINKIVTQIKKDKLKKNIDVVFIDLINRISDSNSREINRAAFLGSITRRLKLLAGKLKIPIVITAQINRTVESRHDKAPTLADIKESGGIAEDSDYVFGLYRNKDLEDSDKLNALLNCGKLDYNSKDADINPECIEIHVLKGRNIQQFKAGFHWKPQYQRISNM